MMDKIGITQVAYLEDRCFNRALFEHRDARIMDTCTKMMLTVARTLRERVKAGTIPPERLCVVIATNSGPVESIQELAGLMAGKGFVALNPSRFPNIMLSTSLARVSVELNARGPCAPFYMNGKVRQPLRYGVVQIKLGRCDGVMIIYADEASSCFGLFMEREASAHARGCDIRFYVPVDF